MSRRPPRKQQYIYAYTYRELLHPDDESIRRWSTHGVKRRVTLNNTSIFLPGYMWIFNYDGEIDGRTVWRYSQDDTLRFQIDRADIQRLSPALLEYIDSLEPVEN